MLLSVPTINPCCCCCCCCYPPQSVDSLPMIRKLWSSPQLWCAMLASSSRGLSWNSGLIRSSTRFSSFCLAGSHPHYLNHPGGCRSILRLCSSSNNENIKTNKEPIPEFKNGEKIQVEVVSFGPMGASVEVVGKGHGPEGLIASDEEPLGRGLILQQEISYFRQGRDYVDVVLGEVLPAYVQHIREDGKIDIGLRSFGGKAKAEEVGDAILKRLEWVAGGSLPIGDKSTPEEISAEFPGVSKSAFKKAVGALYRKGLVQPSPKSITLTAKE